MPVVHSREFEFGFSLKKQANLATAIATAAINKKLPYRGFGPTSAEFPDAISDADWYGKGHNFATFYDRITRRVVIPDRMYSMTPLAAMFAFGFLLGDVSTSSPHAGVYDHRFTFMDPGTTPDVRCTSYLEKAGSEYQNIISGAYLSQVALAATLTDHVTLGWSGYARKMASDVTALPALTAQTFFKLIKSSFMFGATGYAEEICAETRSFNMTFMQNPDPKYLACSTPGEEDLVGRVLIGKQSVSGSIAFWLDAALRQLFLDNDECELTVEFQGDAIGVTGYKHGVFIQVPHFKIATESFSEEGQTTLYTSAFTDQTVLKDAVDAYVAVIVRTDISGSEILVTSP